AEFWILNLGYLLLISSLIIKNYRISVLFNTTKLADIGVKSRLLKDGNLLLVLLVLLGIQMIILLILTVAGSYSFTLTSITDNKHPSNDYSILYCNKSLSTAQTVVRFLLIVISCIYSYNIRNVPSKFNESKQLA